MASYDLSLIQQTVAKHGIESFTMMALNGIVTMGMNMEQALAVIAKLTPSEFYKTMPSQKDPSMFQDVYRALTPNGKTAYIKFTAYTNGRVVIQFKEK